MACSTHSSRYGQSLTTNSGSTSPIRSTTATMILFSRGTPVRQRKSKIGFLKLVNGAPFRFIDGGRLYNARFVERMTLFAAELGQRQGFFPRMNWRLLGEPWTPGKADQVKELIARN